VRGRSAPHDLLCARAKADAARTDAQRKAIADAQKIVAIWNARQAGGRSLWFYPTIGAAIAAGVPWLGFSFRRWLSWRDPQFLER
jgi:hypothetical protein